MKKPTKKALDLLRSTFNCTNKNGVLVRAAWSGISTCNGTLPLWGQLVLAGYVRQTIGGLGHPFNYELTAAGADFLKSEGCSTPQSGQG